MDEKSETESEAKKKVLSVLYAWDEKVKFKSKKKTNESEIEKKKKEGNISELYAHDEKEEEKNVKVKLIQNSRH